MLTNPLIKSVLVWDGGVPVVPDDLMPRGKSREEGQVLVDQLGQFKGSNFDVLAEIGGRSCYDSAGYGRPSGEFHANIRKVNHLSVYEHCAFTVNIHTRRHEDVTEYACLFLNQPTIFVRQVSPYDLRVTLNLRHVLEWGKTRPGIFVDQELIRSLGAALWALGHIIAPLVVPEGQQVEEFERNGRRGVAIPGTYATLEHVPAGIPQEQWITLFMTGSRGFSHELVRHGDWTAISQRSTRYVDENESPWVEHPLESMLRSEDLCDMAKSHVFEEAKLRYVTIRDQLEGGLISRGVDKFTARKQARGAARGYLGNALLTEVVFSANVTQWLHMMDMRACQAADAEIRESFCKALPELSSSQYGEHFNHLTLETSPDGIGQVVIKGA